MELSIVDRLVLLNALPREGDYATLKILSNLRMSLSFTEDEIRDWEIDSSGGHTTWQNGGVADIPIGEKATDIVVEALKKLNSEKKLTVEMMDTYDKFIPTTE